MSSSDHLHLFVPLFVPYSSRAGVDDPAVCVPHPGYVSKDTSRWDEYRPSRPNHRDAYPTGAQ